MNKILNLLKIVEASATKIYLVIANLILVIFGIWFTNVGILPFAHFGDFAFFSVLGIILAIYRPSWTFAFFIGTLVLENINLAPKNLGLAIRPYQFFGLITLLSLAIQYFSKRFNFTFPKWKWYDLLPIIFAAGGFLSSLNSPNRGISLKQSLVAFSFVALFYLVRIYIQSRNDLKRVAPFFEGSATIILIYGIWQNWRFMHGANAFEVMSGRPNGTFTEPDWYGIFLVFLLAIIFTRIYNTLLCKDKEIKNQNAKFKNTIQNTKVFVLYMFVTLTFIVLILTVSRSAWLGAILVTIGFLKVFLTQGSLKISSWKWKEFAKHTITVGISLVLAITIVFGGKLTNFQIGNRAASTGGLQQITIACSPNHAEVPSEVNNISELSQYGCHFINLEDIEKEVAAGNIILKTNRPDPTLNIRAKIYQQAIAQIKAHSILGIGWGSISRILGNDENGNGLNASNIFLEVWLGSGLLGFAAFVILLGWVFVQGVTGYLDNKVKDKTVVAFVLLGWTAIVVPNLFNSGIFLAFLWVYLAASVSLLDAKK